MQRMQVEKTSNTGCVCRTFHVKKLKRYIPRSGRSEPLKNRVRTLSPLLSSSLLLSFPLFQRTIFWTSKYCKNWFSHQKTVKIWQKNWPRIEGIIGLIASQKGNSFARQTATEPVNSSSKNSHDLTEKPTPHWGDSLIKIESFCPPESEAQIDSFQSWKGGGRPAGKRGYFLQ